MGPQGERARSARDHHEVHARADDFEELWPTADLAPGRPDVRAGGRRCLRAGQAGAPAREGRCCPARERRAVRRLPEVPLAREAAAAAAVPPRPLRRGAVDRARAPPADRRLARARIALRAAMAAPTEADRLAYVVRAVHASRAAEPCSAAAPAASARPRPVEGVDAIERMLRHDCQGWLPDNLLERGDRMAMAASVELRPPFLDHHLVELAFRLAVQGQGPAGARPSGC